MRQLILSLRLALALIVVLAGAARAEQSAAFGAVVVHYSAISTDQLGAESARRYGIERGARHGLVNIAIERKTGDGAGEPIAAVVSGSVAALAGQRRPIRFRETRDEGGIDYLGEFPLDASGTYVSTIEVAVPGSAQPYNVTFNRDYVLD